jgi:hypothetical protein
MRSGERGKVLVYKARRFDIRQRSLIDIFSRNLPVENEALSCSFCLCDFGYNFNSGMDIQFLNFINTKKNIVLPIPIGAPKSSSPTTTYRNTSPTTHWKPTTH